MPVQNLEYNSYFQHFSFVDMIEQFLMSCQFKGLLPFGTCLGVQYFVILFTVTICLSSIDNALILFCFYFPGRGNAEAEEETEVCVGQEMAVRQKKT